MEKEHFFLKNGALFRALLRFRMCLLLLFFVVVGGFFHGWDDACGFECVAVVLLDTGIAAAVVEAEGAAVGFAFFEASFFAGFEAVAEAVGAGFFGEMGEVVTATAIGDINSEPHKEGKGDDEDYLLHMGFKCVKC